MSQTSPALFGLMFAADMWIYKIQGKENMRYVKV